ncbi:MAG: hypothetical protein ACM3TN_13805 [Alphaproteobacteria bacterium]
MAATWDEMEKTGFFDPLWGKNGSRAFAEGISTKDRARLGLRRVL